MNLNGFVLARFVTLTIEALILSVRLFIYYYYEDDRAENLTEDYLQEMIQAGFASLSTCRMSIAEIAVGAGFCAGSMTSVV